VLYGNKLKVFDCLAKFYCCRCALNDFQCYNVEGQDTQDGYHRTSSVYALIQSRIVVNEISNKYGIGGILISSNIEYNQVMNLRQHHQALSSRSLHPA
jgi:hypothetical protein